MTMTTTTTTTATTTTTTTTTTNNKQQRTKNKHQTTNNNNSNNNNNGNNNASNCVARHTQIALEAIISSAPRSSEADLLLFTIQFAFPSGLGQQQKQQNLHFVWPGTDKSYLKVIFPRRHAHPKRICCYLQYSLHLRVSHWLSQPFSQTWPQTFPLTLLKRVPGQPGPQKAQNR